MSLLRSRPSPVWVIGPRSVLSPVECSMGTKPRNPPSWRIFSSSRQSPILARSSGRHLARMALANRAEKFPKLAIFSNRRPRGLNELTSKPPISGMGDRSPIGFVSGGVLHGDQTQKSSQLADIFKLAPIADPRQKLAGHDPTNAGNRHHILNALRQFGVGLTKAADLFGRFKDLLLGKLQTVKQLIELKAHRVRTGKLSEFCLHYERPLAAGWSRGKGNPLEQQQRFNALLHPHRLTHHRIAKLSEVAKLAI